MTEYEYFGYGPADADMAIQWELKNSIAIIRPTSCLEDLLELMDRYETMHYKYKDISDEASYKIFGIKTRENFELIKRALEENEISELFTTDIMPKMVFYKNHINMLLASNAPAAIIFETILRIRKNCKSCYEDAVFSNIVSNAVTKYKSNNSMELSFNDYPILRPDRMEELGIFQDDPIKNCFGVHGDDSILSKQDRKDWYDKYKLSWNTCCGVPGDRTGWVSKVRSLFNNIDYLDENAQKARRQSILELGWNPMIPFTPENRKYSDEVYKSYRYKFMNNSNLVDMRGIDTTGGDPLNKHNCLLFVFIYPDEFLQLEDGETPLLEFIGYSFDGVTAYSPCKDGMARINISAYRANVDHNIAAFGTFLSKENYDIIKEKLRDMSLNPYKYTKDIYVKFNKLNEELRRMLITGEISDTKMVSMYKYSLQSIFGLNLENELSNHVFFLSCRKAKDYKPDNYCFKETSIRESSSISIFDKDKISLNEIMNLDISNSCNDGVIIEAYNTFIAPIQNGFMIPTYIEENKFEFINDFNILMENAPPSGTKPFFIILFKGKMPWSPVIAKVTHSQFSHASVAFDPNLNTMYSFNMNKDKNGEKANGFIKESIKTYKDNDIEMGVFCLFCSPKVISDLHKFIKEFDKNKEKYKYSMKGLVRFLFNMPKDYNYKMFCSQFCDKLLKAAGIDITDNVSALVSPGTFERAANNDNRIYSIFTGRAVNYKPGDTKNQITKMLKSEDTFTFGEMCDISYLNS